MQRKNRTYKIVCLITTMIVTWLNANLATGQAESGKIDYVAELNKLGMAGRAESDNAAPFYQKAIELYVVKPKDLMISKVTWPKELPPQEQTLLRKWVQDNSKALEKLQLGSQKSYCWFTQTGQKLQANPHLTEIRDLAKALQARVMLQAEEGNVTGAINDIVILYKFGAHISEGPKPEIEKLTGIGVKSFSIRAAFNILGYKIVETDLMKNLQDQLEQSSANQNESLDVRGEKMYIQEQIETDPNRLPFKPYLKNALEYYDTMAVKTPWQLHNEQTQSTASDNPLLAVEMAKIIEIEYRSRADTQALITTIAVLRYKSDRGEYPATLQELVSAGYIKDMTIDPFSNKPLVYKQTKETFTLYSFGADYDDDGGQPSRWGYGEEGGDAVFWPVERPQIVQSQEIKARPVPSTSSGQALSKAESSPAGTEENAAAPVKIDESLHQAIIAGDVKQVQTLIANGVDINSRNMQNWTPLHTAIWYGNKEMVELISSKGADVNAQESQGYTPLHFAAIRGDSNSVDLLIEKGANVNAKTPSNQTVLYLAAEGGYKNIVEKLIAKGADVNEQAGSENALSIAQKKGNNEIAELLLKHGAKEPTVTQLEGQPYGSEGQTGRAVPPPSRAQAEFIGDPNEIIAWIKSFEGLEKALEEVDNKSRNEKGAWLQRKLDNRVILVRLVEEQVKGELTLTRTISAEEKAEKTTKAIDDTLSSREKISNEIRKELLEQRKTQQGAQRSSGRSQGRAARGSRGMTQSPSQGQQPVQEMAGPYGGRAGITPRTSGLRGEPNESQPTDLESDTKINQWLQTGTDNKENLLQNVYTDIQTQYISIRAVASEEGAKKTTAAIDGLLLKRQERADDLLMRIEKESQQIQEPRGRGTGRATRGGQQSQWGQPGQEQNIEQTPGRSRRR